MERLPGTQLDELKELDSLIQKFGYAGFLEILAAIYHANAFRQEDDTGRTVFKGVGKKLYQFGRSLKRFENGRKDHE